jgi:Aspartyl protease
MGQKQTDLPFRLVDGWAVVVKGTIGSEPSRTILIDTGAVPSAISKEMAKKMGLLGTAEQVSVMNRPIDVERVRVPRIQVGPVAADAFEMVVVTVHDLFPRSCQIIFRRHSHIPFRPDRSTVAIEHETVG